MATTIEGIDGLKATVGEHLGYSDWHEITQDQVNLFADATGDHQWIHVDPERAKAGPFGGPIAHGYLTLSLAPVLMPQVLQVTGISMGVNYGLQQAPLPVAGAGRRRSCAWAPRSPASTRSAAAARPPSTLTFEVEGATSPRASPRSIYRYYA